MSLIHFLALSYCLLFTPFAFSKASIKPIRVAFIGDQGLSLQAKQVLELIKKEGSELIIHQGDFDYADNPLLWEKQVNEILGKDFAYVASAGNHDSDHWFKKNGYQQLLEKRAQRIPALDCEGVHGVNAVCLYRDLVVVTSGVGSVGKGTYKFLKKTLKKYDHHPWKICSWHKQQRAYQVGSKTSAVPWKYYKACRQHGAIIAQGHEHSYSRTHTMSHFRKIKVFDFEPDLKVGQGLSFAFTNGLGGAEIRPQALCKKPTQCPQWANIYTKTQGAKPGALFCTFNKSGHPHQAQCYFKNIDGDVIDDFRIQNLLP